MCKVDFRLNFHLFCCRRKWSCFIFVLFVRTPIEMIRFKLSIVFAVHFCVVWSARNASVFNPKLDIILLFDGSPSMGHVKLTEVKDDFGQWIKDYKNGYTANESRFAIMNCNVSFLRASDPVPVLYFDEDTTMNPAAVVSLVKSMSFGLSYENVDKCAKVTSAKILEKRRGSREGVKKVVFFITDCLLDTFKEADDQMKILLAKIEALLFVCISKKTGGHSYNATQIEVMSKWLNNDTRKIFNYTNKNDIVAKLNELLPKLTVLVNDCVAVNISTECVQGDYQGICSKTTYQVITIVPDPPMFADPCPPSFQNVTETCDCSTTVDSKTSTERTTSTEPNESTEKLNSTYLLIGIVALLMVALLIGVIATATYLRRKNKEKIKSTPGKVKVRETGKGIQADTKREEKEKGLAADIMIKTEKTVRESKESIAREKSSFSKQVREKSAKSLSKSKGKSAVGKQEASSTVVKMSKSPSSKDKSRMPKSFGSKGKTSSAVKSSKDISRPSKSPSKEKMPEAENPKSSTVARKDIK